MGSNEKWAAKRHPKVGYQRRDIPSTLATASLAPFLELGKLLVFCLGFFPPRTLCGQDLAGLLVPPGAKAKARAGSGQGLCLGQDWMASLQVTAALVSRGGPTPW